MEIIRAIALLGFFVFCVQIVYKHRQLTKKGIAVSIKKRGLKNATTTLLLLVFFILFTSQLILQTCQIPGILTPTLLNINLHHSNTLKSVGSLTIILSVVCMHFTLSAFKNSLRFGLNANNLGKLITSGIFAHSRNPFFVAILMLLLGIALVFPSPFFVLITVLSIFTIHLFILKEEKFMIDNYGEEYQHYCNTVRRYF